MHTLNSKFHIKVTFYHELEEMKLRVLTKIEDRDDEGIRTLFIRANITKLTKHLHDAVACEYFVKWTNFKSQEILTDCFSRSGRSNKVMFDYLFYDQHYFVLFRLYNLIKNICTIPFQFQIENYKNQTITHKLQFVLYL